MQEPDFYDLLVQADSHLSWALHRYSERWTDDFKRDVEKTITDIRKMTK